LTTNGSSRNTRVAIAIYLLPILCSLRGMPRRSHRLGKDSISHDLPPAKKTIQKADSPSSVLHFSNSVPRFRNSRGEPCIVNGGVSVCNPSLRPRFLPFQPTPTTPKVQVREGS
jgi:hypothetical protein